MTTPTISSIPHLVAVPDLAPEQLITDTEDALQVCKGCDVSIRPYGTTEAMYPGTAPSWGNGQCRPCDYLAAGKDPADRFIPAARLSYLTGLRNDIETARRRRGVPATGSMAGRIPMPDFLTKIS